ncbi:phosphoglycerate kinase [bacterium]|nr:MAG: phosphoglycerate kinase [bacterium]
MTKLSVQDLDLAGRRVLIRTDFNVPINAAGAITDDTRIRASLATLRLLLDAGALPVIMSHLGRPGGQVKPEFSLAPVAARLAELLGQKVHLAADCVGKDAAQTVGNARAGELVLLENLRFHAGETANDPDFARQLAASGQVYVNDAFGTAHRAHASTAGVAAHFEQCAAGLLMGQELERLSALLQRPRRPFVAILGGAKVSGKIEVVDNLIGLVEEELIGGGMAFTFFRAMGLEVGSSLVEEKLVDQVAVMIERARESRTRITLPEDVIIADQFSEDAQKKEVLVTDIESGWMGLDIGSRTIKRYSNTIGAAGTIFWNGPMGVFEMDSFARGTRAVARAVARATDEGAHSVVGGGDSVAALGRAGLANKITHVSTGGGASLEFMAGKELPGVQALSEAAGEVQQ